MSLLEVTQVVPQNDYTVVVYFNDGKIVLYDTKPLLGKGVFSNLENIDFIMNRCTVLNHTLAWDLYGNHDEAECIDIDPYTLHELPE